MSGELPPSTLRWRWPAGVAEEWQAGFVGPGGPFELTTDDVLGQRLDVFAQRSPSLRATLERGAERFGDLPYLVFPAEPAHDVTYHQTRDRVAALARRLVDERGLRPGDRVAIAAANCLEYALLAYATACAGGIVVGLNGWWTTPELAYGLELTAPALVVGDARRLERLAAVDSPAGRGAVDFDELFADLPTGEGVAMPEVALAEDDPVLILFTSGTTGRPKGAVLTHRNLAHIALSSALGMAITAVASTVPPAEGQNAMALVAPLFHVSGVVPLFASAPTFGSRLVLPPPGRWDERQQLRLTEDHGISSWSVVPTQLARMLALPDFDRYDLSSLRTIGVGGAMLATDLVRAVHERLPDVRITNGYGMTESVGNGTRGVGQVLVDHPGTVGFVEAGVEVQIREPDGRTPAPDGEVGEIHLRGASVFRGYWDDEAASAAVLDDRRWYRTGDFGRVADGMLYLESRLRDLIIRGGENVYPIEVENRLADHPAVLEVAVIGVDHDVLGQEVKAFVVLHDGASLTLDEAQAWVAETLAPFKVPAHLEIRPDLPTTASGKVMKHVLEAESAR